MPELAAMHDRLAPPRDRHWVAGAAAVLVSAALHFGLVRWFPALPVGRLADTREQVRYPSIEMRDVRREPALFDERPPVFRPEDPGRLFERTPGAEPVPGDTSIVEFKAPELEPPELAGEASALADAPREVEREPWNPRQEVLAISERVHADEVSALPRRYAPDVPRAAVTPDIKPPSDRAFPELTHRGGPDMPRVEHGAVRDPAMAPAAGTSMARAFGVGDGARLLDERRDEVTKILPVEQLLELDVRSHRPADEPDMLYFRVEIRRKQDALLPVLPKDVLLIQDCSESMTQRKLDDCKEGLLAWVGKLNEGDRVELMGFRDDVYFCFGGWTEATPVARARARAFIGEMVARGQTDIYQSLQETLKVRRDGNRPLVALLVTDGRPTTGVVDSSEIIEQFTRSNDGSRSMFCLGGGRKVNRFLLDLLSYRNRGDSAIVEDRTQIPGRMDALALETARPVLSDLAYRISPLGETEIYPRRLTHLYLDRPLVVYGRCRAGTGRAVMQTIGRSGPAAHDMVFELDLDGSAEGGAAIRTDWVWHRIYELIARHIETGSTAVMDEITALSAKYGVNVPYRGDIPLP